MQNSKDTKRHERAQRALSKMRDDSERAATSARYDSSERKMSKRVGSRMRKISAKTKTVAVKGTKAGAKLSVKGVKAGAKLSAKVIRATHTNLAVKPHEQMRLKFNWYDRWHNKSYHTAVHILLLSVYMGVVGGFVFMSYQRAMAASDITSTWDFSNSADYNLDSDIEINAGQARFKPLEYTTDEKTAALYHMNEAGGSALTDSSANTNNGTVTNGTFGVGNLNGGLAFNGTNIGVVAPDSPSLAFQKNTIEAWTKLSNNFSAGSSYHRQTIVDKGDYQLYYDNETGRVVYELADNSTDNWTQVAGNALNGSWDQDGNRSVNAQVKMGSDIYVGVGYAMGDAEVWKLSGGQWTMIGGGQNSINNSWDKNTYEGVYAIETDGTNIYAGLGKNAGEAEVWKWDGSTWTKFGGDSVNNSWNGSSYEQVWALDYLGGKLYVGLGSSANDAEVWVYQDDTWSQIGGDSLNSGWTTNYEIVSSLTDDGTNIYAGLGTTAGDSEVWKWDGATWTKLGGDELNGSWGATIETVRSLKYLGGKLYAGIGDTAGDAEVWSFNGTTWTKIGGDGLNDSWATNYEQIGGLAWDGTNLYAGLGTSNGDGEVWKYNGSTWSQVGGDGLNDGWTTAQGDIVNTLMYDNGKIYAGLYDSGGDGLYYSFDGSNWTILGGGYVNASWGYYGMSTITVMQAQGGYLYAGTGTIAGAAQVYRFDGNNWQIIGGQGVNNSWDPFTYEQVLSMASYKGNLYVGLGTTAGDAEVWKWSGSTWSQIGGDGLNSSWPILASHYNSVDSMASIGDYLYAGLGSAPNDGEIWRYDGSSWDKIGGDSLNSGWTNYVEDVYSMADYQDKLVVGLGRSAGDGEVWQWSGSAWTQIGGDAINSSWGATATVESVESLMSYNGKLYAGLGNSSGDASLWQWDGTTWTQVGGDNINNSWDSGIYEKVKSIASYNGDLYVGLGNTTGDGEVWRLRGGSWDKIGGNSLNGGWSSVVEEIESFSPYKGKLYVGTGSTANADNQIWSLGNNGYLESTTSSFNTDWHHIAATYNGSTMKLYIDGNLDAQTSANITLPNNHHPLLIGTSYGGSEVGKARGVFDGSLDELRLSNDARSSFNALPLHNGTQTVTLANASHPTGVWHWDSFSADETPNGGTITYRLSADDGSTWLYWDGDEWAESAAGAQSNAASDVNAHIADFPVTLRGMKWQALLTGNGNQKVTLNSVTAEATSDLSGPSDNASNITAKRVKDGSSLNENTWTNGGSPYFAWDEASDDESGVLGYCLYLGHDNTADPASTAGLLGASPNYTGGACQFMVTAPELDLSHSGYLASALTTSSQPYYLLVKSIDKAGNLSGSSAQFNFKFDNTPPANPVFITAPSGFIKDKHVTLTWPIVGGNAPQDNESGIAGLQYKIGSSGTWYGDNHDGTGSMADLLTNDGSYALSETFDFDDIQEGINNIYFRTWDQAGNVTSTYVSAILKINTNGSPSEPLNLVVTPATNTQNLFSFYWSPPTDFVGDVGNLVYCYTVNTLPSESTCNFTPPGTTNLSAGPYATQPGSNVVYLVARDESGNINYDNYTSATFTANTPAPGMPLSADVVDLSIKATSNWRLGITWEEPSGDASNVASYKIYRSVDSGGSWAFTGSSTSTTYIDAGLTQKTYQYKVQACDNANNCGAFSSTVQGYPTGKFTSPATIVADPETSDITTRKVRISWSTDRASDSKVAIGTKSGEYSPSEIGNSDQVSSHIINIDNLAAGTTYYYVAKWTDEDGNTGTSQEYSFTTSPAPSLKEVTATKLSVSGAVIQFTSNNASKVEIFYGKSDSFGGTKTINTSLTESSYSVNLDDLSDGTKYFYKLVTYDTEGNSYDSNVYSFTTPSRPRITNLRFQPVANKPTSTQEVTWETNVPSTSTLVYGKVGGKQNNVSSLDMATHHTLTVSGLEDDSEYKLTASSRDGDGNLAVSDTQTFHTALDTRPPEISNVTIEPTIRGVGAEARGQVVVSWHTDEPATSQVAYGEGAHVEVFNSLSAEDGGLATEHVVIISDLPTSKVYSIQPISHDKSGNVSKGASQSTIIGRASDSIMTVILNTLRGIFGL